MCYSKQRRALCVVFALLLLVVIICAFGVWLTLIYLNSREVQLQRESDKIYIRSLVDAVNDHPTNTWKARLNPFGIRTVDEMMPEFIRNETEMRVIDEDLMNMFSSKAMQSHIQQLVDRKEPLPTHFDAREKWPLCRSIRNVPNQGGCGSCYAVATTGVASDRACIASNGTIQTFFSEQDVISCCVTCGGCLGGGFSLMVLHYWITQGFVTGGRDGCIPYTANVHCGTPCSPAEFKTEDMCNRKCQSIYTRNSYENDRHFGSLAYRIYPTA